MKDGIKVTLEEVAGLKNIVSVFKSEVGMALENCIASDNLQKIVRSEDLGRFVKQNLLVQDTNEACMFEHNVSFIYEILTQTLVATSFLFFESRKEKMGIKDIQELNYKFMGMVKLQVEELIDKPRK